MTQKFLGGKSLFVEGMDNAGKTTIVKQIASTFGLPVVVSCFDSRPKYDTRMFDVYVRVCRMIDMGIQFVGDRLGIISEEVYGPFLRGVNDITSQSVRDPELLFQHFFLGTHPLVIYCRPADHVIMDFGDREQMDGVVERAETLLDRYDTMMADLSAKFPGQIYYYDWQEAGANDKLMEVIRLHLTQ